MSRLSRPSPLLTLALALAAAPAVASLSAVVFEAQPQSSSVEFVAHTSLFDAVGVFDRFSVSGSVDPDDLTTASVVATVDTSSVDSGIELRDKHLRGADFFWVERYPQATFRSARAFRAPDGALWVSGPLSLRGVTKTVEFPLDVSGQMGDGGLRVVATLPVSRRGFGIVYDGGALMPEIEDTVDIRFSVTLQARRGEFPES